MVAYSLNNILSWHLLIYVIYMCELCVVYSMLLLNVSFKKYFTDVKIIYKMNDCSLTEGNAYTVAY